MDRRDFVRTMLASTGAVIAGTSFSCLPAAPEPGIFPVGTRPDQLFCLNITREMDWHMRTSLACFQGLVNRDKTRIYLNTLEQDMFWLDYYADRYQINYHILVDIEDLVDRFRNDIAGYIVYDPEMPHSLNLATTMGALQNAVPVSRHLAGAASGIGLKKIDDLTGKWKDLYEAYEWALVQLFPQSNHKLMAHLCVHHPHWPTSSWTNRDYIIAHKILSVDISASERDKRDYNLLKKYYEQYPEETVIFGWHCVRDSEHEAIALSSAYGHYGMCSLHTSNLTVHSSVSPSEREVYHQRSIEKSGLKVENKIYAAIMATDGDAAWFVQNLVSRQWASPVHGQFKYNWGFLPMAYDFMPALVDYYMKNLKPSDYFVAGPAGATYTYPHLHPHPEKFLRLSQAYMKKCGLTTVHMTNWNDRDWWQEVNLPNFHNSLKETMPDCLGYTRGMGESAFEKHYIKGGKPLIFCGEGFHRGEDIHRVLTDFTEACPNRPLFVYILANHNIPVEEIKAAVDKFSAAEIEIVHLDELLLLIEKAFEEGKITEDLYPEKDGLIKLLIRDAKNAWPAFYQSITAAQRVYNQGEDAYISDVKNRPTGLEEVISADFLAFETIWQTMKMVKLALEAKGIYVNHKPTASVRFVSEFNHLPDVKLVPELQQLWDQWHITEISYKNAEAYARRLSDVVNHLNNTVFKAVS